ncbi:MAG: restriction endonuclease subunit S [Nitrosomonadales bacterium]|nr:restriction endonuclease subunit S [Nitrosomonadales bacterium]
MSLPRYPEYKDSGVAWLGEVPGHWKVTQLKRVVDPMRSITYGIVQAGAGVEDGVPYIRPADMSEECGILDETNLLRTSIEIAASYARSTIKQGDLVCSIGPSFGKLMVVPHTLDGANLTQGTARIAVSAEHSPKYIFWSLRSATSFSQWESSVGGATFRALNLGPLAETYISAPLLEEQTAIATFLDRETGKIDALIAEQQRLVELLAEKRQAVISHAVTKGLNPNARMKDSGIEWLGEVPEHWEVKRLKTISPFISVGIVVNPSDYVSDDGLPFIYGGDITEGRINFHTSRRITDHDSRRNEKTRLSAGDLLTVRVGAPGITAVVPPECEGGNCASVMYVRKGNFNSQWLCYSMNDRTVRYQVEVVQYGAAQEQFNISHAINFWLATPPREEQDAIASYLDTETAKFDTLTTEANRAIALLQERRSALISAAVTGKIVVTNTN